MLACTPKKDTKKLGGVGYVYFFVLYHGCLHMFKLIKLYLLCMCSSLNSNYISIRAVKERECLTSLKVENQNQPTNQPNKKSQIEIQNHTCISLHFILDKFYIVKTVQQEWSFQKMVIDSSSCQYEKR